MKHDAAIAESIKPFTDIAGRWWDESGPFAPLHRMNPCRLSYIKDTVCDHFGRKTEGLKPLRGLTILDIGCGGGLICEPMARLGADVTGIDADPNAVAVAGDHAKAGGLEISYKNIAAEELAGSFDVVLALEVAEHVDNPASLVRECARLVRPGGIVIFSTLNRTARSYALGIVAAEYLLRWVPKGTHQWQKFIKPAELARTVRNEGLGVQEVRGLIYDPLRRDFRLSRSDLAVNYFLTATRP